MPEIEGDATLAMAEVEGNFTKEEKPPEFETIEPYAGGLLYSGQGIALWIPDEVP